ncbi:MAG TPA: hypothetical protein VGO59_18330 [Verrucomicrobiae bacterium]
MIRLFVAVLFVGIASAVRGDVSVLTQHNDAGRTGANLRETILNTSNVSAGHFGLVFKRAVDDQIYGQPLIAAQVNLGAKGTRNIVIVATVNDSVYAFDADNPSAGEPYWKVNFLGPHAVPPRVTDMTDACGGDYQDFSGNIGIVSTPVVDAAAGTVYVLARTKENGKDFVQRFHALDLRTGMERPHSPVVIAADYPGHGAGNAQGVIHFDNLRQNQRAGLALVRGVVYIAWTSHCDWGPYHGWLIGYDAQTLRQRAIYNTTPDGYNGGIWMSGQGPAADGDGNLYITVGNGSVGTDANRSDPINRGESMLKLTPDGASMRLASWFTPHNWFDLESTDNDFGNSGPMLIPGTHLAFSGTKEGRVYLVNRDQMGGLGGAGDGNNGVQTFQVSRAGASAGLFGSPVWWKGPDAGYAYIWCKEDCLRQYKFDPRAGKFVLPEFSRTDGKDRARMPGGILSLSADGSKAGTGIVWATHTISDDANHQVGAGILQAYNAERVEKKLWSSDQVPDRDAVGNFAKFVPPTVANGKVYVATFSDGLNVYGLLPGAR